MRTRTLDNPPVATGAPGASARIFRALVRGRLGGLAEGQLEIADGEGPWQAGEAGTGAARVRVHDPRFYRDLVLGGSLGAARSYIDGRWSSDDLPALIALLVRNTELADGFEGGLARLANGVARLRHRLRRNTLRGSRRNIHDHYDLGNDLFELFLDRTMTYSSGIFAHPQATLEEASIEKLDRICRKLALGPDTHVVEIGTGWGSFAIHAARLYGCRVTTTTISREQHDLAAERIRDAGVEDRVELLLEDYRNLNGRFDRLVSIEMVEAVGHEHLGTYLGKCAELLHADGAALVQAITMPDQRYAQYLRSSDFIRHHVFPGSCVPSIGALVDAAGRASDLKLVHLEDLAPHYARTLRSWRERFLAQTDAVRGLGYPERFIRLWDFYLAYCEAGFEERYIGTSQILMHKPRCRLDAVAATTDAARIAA